MEDSTATFQHSLGQQLHQVGNQIEKIKTTLQSTAPTIPDYLFDTLSHISEHTRRIGDHVTQNDTERKNLLALADISQVVNSSLKLNAVLQIVMDTIIRLTGAERGFLMLRDPDGTLSIRTARNWEQESIHSSEYAISKTIVHRVVNEGIPILTTNAQEDPRFDEQESVIVFNLRSVLCVPLKVKDELTGVIYADNRIRSGIFTENEKDLLASFANQAAVAIENAQLFESIHRTLSEVTELKDMMANIFASIASGVMTADIEENITLCNQAAERILGYTESTLTGRCINECLPSIAAELASPMTEVRETNQPVLGVEVAPILPNRGLVDLVFNLSPLKDANHGIQGVAIVLDDLTEKKRLEAERRLFERMVPPAVIDKIDLDKLQLGGERATITTLFADVRGFTSFSESLSPEKLVSILNLYLAAAAESVLAQDGTLDKFMGDSVMAIFNAPIQQEDHTLRAVRAAINIQESVHKIHHQLPPEFQLGFGIGIHLGDAVLGLIGTEKRVDYTAIGNSVNIAKRLQENASESQILISKLAHEPVRNLVNAKILDSIIVKGKREPIEVLEILGMR